jgi:hypothetical protein
MTTNRNPAPAATGSGDEKALAAKLRRPFLTGSHPERKVGEHFLWVAHDGTETKYDTRPTDRPALWVEVFKPKSGPLIEQVTIAKRYNARLLDHRERLIRHEIIYLTPPGHGWIHIWDCGDCHPDIWRREVV